MAVGDVVNVLLSSGTSYQPAVGVELVIMTILNGEIATIYGVTDGVDSAINYTAADNSVMLSQKIGLTNGIYYSVTVGAATGGFSAFQTK
jgi:hypothetical protein